MTERNIVSKILLQLYPWKKCNASPVWMIDTTLSKTQLCVRLHNSIPVPMWPESVNELWRWRMVPYKLWVLLNFSRISLVSQSRFLVVTCVLQSRFYTQLSQSLDVLHGKGIGGHDSFDCFYKWRLLVTWYWISIKQLTNLRENVNHNFF